MLNREEKRNFLNACEMLEPAQFYIDDTPSLSTMELRAKGRRMKAQHDIEMIVIDYMQLMSGSAQAAADWIEGFIAVGISHIMLRFAGEAEPQMRAIAEEREKRGW